jgi:SAM-dependent methyltransferase
MSDFVYVGSELDLFAEVHHWKSYWSKHLRPFISGDVLEVGAGIGANTLLLDQAVDRAQWVCLEPDPRLAAELLRNLQNADLPKTDLPKTGLPKKSSSRKYDALVGTIQDLEAGRLFDTIVYVDVLEHIENDSGELRAAASRLRPGGCVLVLSPAHQSLFTPFDAAIGHYRRYDKSMLRACSPPELRLEQLKYLDCVGLLASTANRLFLRQSMPTKAQLRVWDNWMVPVSTVLDKLLFYSLGKSIIGVWRKPIV